jgi:alkylhydroperoxidase family enzyme
MRTTADTATSITPTRISRLEVPEVDALSNQAVKGFFTHQQREEGLTSNWFRALSLNEDDLGRLNAYLLPLLGTDGRGGLTAREREVIATVGTAESRVHRRTAALGAGAGIARQSGGFGAICPEN